MFGLAIATVLGSPVAFLLVGFLGVSRKRAEESREHLDPSTRVTTQPTAEPGSAIV